MLFKLTDFVNPLGDVPGEVRKVIKHKEQWIDYWAVDWDNRSDTFHNEWQSYRARKEKPSAIQLACWKPSSTAPCVPAIRETLKQWREGGHTRYRRRRSRLSSHRRFGLKTPRSRSWTEVALHSPPSRHTRPYSAGMTVSSPSIYLQTVYPNTSSVLCISNAPFFFDLLLNSLYLFVKVSQFQM